MFKWTPNSCFASYEATASETKTARNERQKRRTEATKATEWLDKSIGMVERIHWNRSTKSMESLDESNGFVYKNWRFCLLKLAD